MSNKVKITKGNELIKAISKKVNIFGDVYSYSISKNEKFNEYRLNEFKNGEFYTDYSFSTKREAIEKMMSILSIGGTGVDKI